MRLCEDSVFSFCILYVYLSYLFLYFTSLQTQLQSLVVSRHSYLQTFSGAVQVSPQLTHIHKHVAVRGDFKDRQVCRVCSPQWLSQSPVHRPERRDGQKKGKRWRNKLWKATFFPACRHYRGNRGKGLMCSVGVFLAATEDLWNNRKPFTLCLVRTWLSTYASMLCCTQILTHSFNTLSNISRF